MFVKICGIKREEDGVAAAELGADAIGFVFYEKSKRFVDFEKAARISMLVGKKALKIGVFVDEEEDEILKVAEKVRLDGVQLHGSEKVKDYKKLIGSGLAIIKAVFPEKKEAEKDFKSWAAATPFILLDSFDPVRVGGTGKSFNWMLMEKFLIDDVKIIVAGGINPDNVSEVMKIEGIWGIDVSSGVELMPGVKSRKKIKMILKKVKGINEK